MPTFPTPEAPEEAVHSASARPNNASWALLALFLAIVVGVPLIQLVHELARREKPRVLRVFQEMPTATRLRAFERELESGSIIEQMVRPMVQFAHFAWLGEGGEKAVIGLDGWLFYRPGIDVAIGTPRHGTMAGLTTDPLPAIQAFREDLARLGIELLIVIAPNKETTFLVKLELPNGAEDEYPADNIARSAVPATPVYDPTLVVAIRTNADSSQTGYAVTNGNGEVVFERRPGTMAVNTVYRDTLQLIPGCYELVVSDTAGDGLDFWFNPEGGYGYARLMDRFGRLLKAFSSDFGREVRHSFVVSAGANPPAPAKELPIVNPFPARNKGLFDIDIFLNRRSDLRIRIIDESGVETVLDNLYTGIKEAMLPIDISTASDGVYYIKVTVDGETVSRRIRVKRTE